MTVQNLEHFMSELALKNSGEKEFCQAVQEVMEDVFPFIREHPEFNDPYLLERLTEPDGRQYL